MTEKLRWTLMLLLAAGGCADDEPTQPQPVCGDGQCSEVDCPEDCGFGPICGDGQCNGNETSATCASDCPAGPRCGDGLCNGNETTASCAGDCPCTDNTSADDTCTGDNVCVSGRCVSAFGRVYKIRVYGGNVLEADAAGTAWDFPGGLPDVLANIELNSVDQGNTLAAANTLMPVWNTEYTATIPGGSTFVIRAYDEALCANAA